MGLGGIMQQWQRQTKDFAHRPDSPYSTLIFDNRGIGQSDKPLMRYSTSEMAKDIVELLDHVGWTETRTLNVIGISMGGMIAQELALLIPERISSLSLISTAPRLVRTLGFFENLVSRANLFVPRPLDVQLANVKRNCYTEAWLNQPDELEAVVQPFPTNGDRFSAVEIRKRTDLAAFRPQGFIAQAIAAGYHHKTADQLKTLADRVGRRRIMVVHGTGDRMVPFVHGPMLATGLGLVEELEHGEGLEPGLVYDRAVGSGVFRDEAGVFRPSADGGARGNEGVVRFIEGQGHVIPIEWRAAFNSWVEDMVARGEAANKDEGL